MRKIIVSFVLIILTSVLLINHIGTVVPKEISASEKSGPQGIRIEKSENSHRHIILQGSDYHRGSEFGRLCQAELLKQEELLISKLDGFIGNSFIQGLFFTSAMLWFYDADKFIDDPSLKEMQGVAKWAPKKYDYLSDGLTRQVAYHGLHEVGQMFVDEDRVDMGCFASAIQSRNKEWVLGRNFDFDVDGIFDREKILKWVFPDQGQAFLSVIWGGMVGAVTGVNQQGIFVAINAAGSDDFARVGTPTTIVVKNILTQSKSLEEAIQILKESTVFITDIFILADRKTNRVVVVEKSPAKMDVHFLSHAEVVANHLQAPIWAEDKNNENRKTNLTSEFRFKRGLELIQAGTFDNPDAKTMDILSDKTLYASKLGHLGHRGAIDSLIASQSVIYDMAKGLFYVNLGPGTTGKYLAYDLDKSFATKYPVKVDEMTNINMSELEYNHWQKQMSVVAEAKKLLNQHKCIKVKKRVLQISNPDFVHYDKEILLGDYAATCLNDSKQAREHWRRALSFNPPYTKLRNSLQEKLK